MSLRHTKCVAKFVDVHIQHVQTLHQLCNATARDFASAMANFKDILLDKAYEKLDKLIDKVDHVHVLFRGFYFHDNLPIVYRNDGFELFVSLSPLQREYIESLDPEGGTSESDLGPSYDASIWINKVTITEWISLQGALYP